MKIVTSLKILFFVFLLPAFIVGYGYVVAQQIYRMDDNDPQVQMSEDIAHDIERGKDIKTLIPGTTTDMATSLAPFVLIYDENGILLSSSGTLGDKMPSFPSGVLNYVKEHGQDRITWQPRSDVRIAAVATYANGVHPEYVVVGRSLREVESRIDGLSRISLFVWFCMVAVLGFFCIIMKKLNLK